MIPKLGNLYGNCETLDQRHQQNHEDLTEYKMILWNCRSIKEQTKKLLWTHILETSGADIICLVETFLTEDDNLFIKGWKIYRGDNSLRRKGVAIFVRASLAVEIAKVAADPNGRFVKIRMRDPVTKKIRTIACTYLEPNGDLQSSIPEQILGSDIIAGDMNEHDTRIEKRGVYYSKNYIHLEEVSVPRAISDHNYIIGTIKLPFKLKQTIAKVRGCDISIVKRNEIEIAKWGDPQSIITLIDAAVTRTIETDKTAIRNLDYLNDWENTRNKIREEWKNRYCDLNKLMTNGKLNQESWAKVNSILQLKKRAEIWVPDSIKEKVVDDFKILYACRGSQIETASNINSILERIIAEINSRRNELENEAPIWPPESNARDWNGFRQKPIEKLIKAPTLIAEWDNFMTFCAKIYAADNSSIFFHTISKAVPFKKEDEVTSGAGLRAICIMPAWIMILEKLALPLIRKRIQSRMIKVQFGYKEIVTAM